MPNFVVPQHPGLPIASGPAKVDPSLGLFAGANDPIARLRMAGLFGGNRDGKPTYTAKDVLDAQRKMAEQFEAPIAPIYGGTKASGIAAGAAAFGNPFVKMMMLGDERRKREENDRVSREALNAASGSKTLEEAVRALSSGSPDQANAALQLRLQQMVKEQERQRQAEIMQQIYGGPPATAQPQTSAQSQPPASAPTPPPPVAPRSVPQPQQLRTDWPFPTDAPSAAAPAAPPSPAALPNPQTDFMMPPAPPAAQPAPAPSRPQHPLTPEGVPQDQIDRLPLNRSTTPPAMPPTPPLAAMPQSQAAPQSEPMVHIGQMRVPLSEARRRAAIGRAQGIDVKPLEEAISLAETGPRAAATETARAQAQAQGGLAQAVNSAQSTIEKLDEIATDPQLESLIGWAWYNPGRYLPDRPEQRALRTRISQVQGRFFLQAFDALRGSGQISNVEGEKAQESIARIMDTHQDIDSYRTAIEDARREIWALTNTARVRAGLQAVPYQPAAPAVGAVRDGYRFNGGDPANPQSWQKVQ
jgi:hypothetical protein